MPLRALLLFLAPAVLSAEVRASSPVAFPPEQVEFFEKKIRPVLAEHCFKCHSTTGEKVKGGLVLDSRASVLSGGDSGPAVVVGDPEKSLIIEAIRYTDEDMQMPPKHRLSPEQIADFEQWVRSGLADPRDGAVAIARPADKLALAKDLWSFQPVRDAAVPAVRNGDWAWNDVDRFLLAKLDEKSVAPNSDADRRTLLRRVTYDLIGLPPSPEEMSAFLADQSPAAFSKVVERLLASPHYGERWGRHWLDVARYADTSGCNSDFPVPSAHRYRNWVIDAFNADKPYDQFLREQIAGDLLPAASDAEKHERTIATGYLAITRRFGSRANEFHLSVEDTIDNVGKAVLGLSLSCARCHDHKFDPVLARDYYALYGIFQSTRYAFPGTEIFPHTKDFVPLAPGEDAELFKKEALELAGLDDRVENLKNEKKRLKRQEIQAAKDRGEEEPEATSLKSETPIPAGEPMVRTAADAQRDLEAALARQAELVVRQERLPKAYAVSEGKPTNARIHRKGEPGNLGDEVPRGFLTALGAQTVPAEEQGSGRLQLAEWLVDTKNPLTARVMVNRIWQHHFGRGLVKSSNDFGMRGELPTHPELLDWLASRFVEGGWSVKAMHRLILASHAYQVRAADDGAKAAVDANNDLFWKFNRRRLSAEEIRDSLLVVSGGLERGMPGPHPFPSEAEFKYTQHRPFIADYATNRRSVYLMQQRIRKNPFLEIFDGADANSTTGVRPLSTTPIQALYLMNNAFAEQQAHGFATRLQSATTGEEDQVKLAFEIALGRPAEAEEVRVAMEALAALREAMGETMILPDELPHRALASFTRALISSNEFLHVD